MTELVRGRHEDVGAGAAARRPRLRVVKVCVAAVQWEEGVSQCAAAAVKRVAVAVITAREPADVPSQVTERQGSRQNNGETGDVGICTCWKRACLLISDAGCSSVRQHEGQMGIETLTIDDWYSGTHTHYQFHHKEAFALNPGCALKTS